MTVLQRACRVVIKWPYLSLNKKLWGDFKTFGYYMMQERISCQLLGWEENSHCSWLSAQVRDWLKVHSQSSHQNIMFRDWEISSSKCLLCIWALLWASHGCENTIVLQKRKAVRFRDVWLSGGWYGGCWKPSFEIMFLLVFLTCLVIFNVLCKRQGHFIQWSAWRFKV